MPAPKKAAPTPDAPVTDAATEAGTNAYGVDLNDPSLKGGTDNPDAQARNEAEMNAQAGTDRPVVEQIANPTPNEDADEADKKAGDASKAAPDAKK